MTKKILLWLGIALLLLIPAGTLSAQGPTRTPTTSGLGSFLGGAQTASTPTSTKTDPVTQRRVKNFRRTLQDNVTISPSRPNRGLKKQDGILQCHPVFWMPFSTCDFVALILRV